MGELSKIIVVGAGPVGLTSAFLLADAGISVTVFEGAPAPARELRASTWHPPTLDMLAPHGLADDLIAAGRVTPTWQIRHHETGERAEFDLSALRGHTRHPYRLQCEQAVYAELLLQRLAALPTAELRFGAEVTAAGQKADTAWIEVGERGHAGRHTADYVIGCDGARSVVRQAIGADFEGSTYPDITILATTNFPFENVLEGLSGVNYIWKDGGTFSLLRLPDVWRCSFYPPPDTAPEDAMDDAHIQGHVDEISPAIGPIEVLERRVYRSHQRIADKYRRGRLFIAGDAAHLNNPKGGMGMNGGIHDAFSLTEKLIAVGEGADPKVLDIYEPERLPVAQNDIIRQADDNRSRMNETDAAARAESLRNLQEVAADSYRCREFLLRSSMITGLRKAAVRATAMGWSPPRR